jgi:hypothetical protein
MEEKTMSSHRHPPTVNLAQVLANQTLLLEAIANAINHPRPHVLGMNEN